MAPEKHIGGYCTRREVVIENIRNRKAGQQYELKGQEKICFKCSGFDLECKLYDGLPINLKRKEE